jgi:tetratricopeptide (TPR) repeat protein
MKAKVCWGIFLIIVSLLGNSGQVFSDAGNAHSGIVDKNNSFGKAAAQVKLEDEGRALLKEGLYAAALEKFKQANSPALKLVGYQDTVAEALIRETYQLQGEYEKALENLEPLLRENPRQWNWQNEKMELEALIESQKLSSAKPAYEFIQFMEKKYKGDLPPAKYNLGITTFVTSAIIRCYDQIGDYDGGIKFIDGILNYFKERDLKKYGKLRWGKGDESYYQVKLALGQDKKEGKKGCLGKAGCVGRATKALIQSDYFPW